jgi:hypothetical protein
VINENEIEEKIQEEIKNLQDSKSFYEKMEHQNSILQLKIHCPSNKYQTEIYLGLKFFIKYYLSALDERKNYYDDLRVEKVFDYLVYLNSIEQIKILKYFIKHLKTHGFDDSIKECEHRLKEIELKWSFKNIKAVNPFKLLFMLTTYNIWTVFASFIIIIMSAFFILLPATSDGMSTVDIKYHTYSHIAQVFI